MKFLAVALIQAIVVLLTYCIYFLTEILAFGRGWAWMVDVFPMFVAGLLAGVLLIFTYTSIGLSLSSVSRSIFPGNRPVGHSVWHQNHGQHREESL